MNQKEIDEFENCIKILAAGGTLEDCLAKYPGLSPEVKANLMVGFDMDALGEIKVPPEAMEKSRQRFLEQAAQYRASVRDQDLAGAGWIVRLKRAFSSFPALKPMAGRVMLVLGITALLIFFSRGLVITSAKSLPGDSLYPVKRVVEDLQVYLSINPQNKLEYEEDISQERVGEIIRLIQLNRIQKISFEGILDAKSNDQWVVSGVKVNILSDTVFVNGLTGADEFIPGSLVEIEGTTNSKGAVDASEIHLREYQLSGTVEKIDKNVWQISGYKIPVDSRTRIEDGILLGDQVVVLVHSADGGMYALSIQIEGEATPAPGVKVPQPGINMPESDATETLEPEQHNPEPTIVPAETHSVEPPDQEEVKNTPPTPGEGSQVSTPEPQSTEEREREGGSATPEQQQTPEPTEGHDGDH